jgi:hypothetical protein
MNKQTQLYVGLGVAAVGAYLLYDQMNKKPKAPFAGTDTNTVVGRRVKMVGMVGASGRRMGMLGAAGRRRGFIAQNAVAKDSRFSYHFSGQNKIVTDSGWVRADGKSIAPNFFDVKDSKFGR